MSLEAARHELLRRIAREPAPTRAALRLRGVLALCGAATLSLSVLGRANVIPVEPRPPDVVYELLGGATLVALIAAWQGIGRGGSILGRTPARLVALLLLVPASLFAWKLRVLQGSPELTACVAGRVGWRCLGWSLLMGTPPLVALALHRAGSEAISPALRGAASGVAVGATSWVLVDVLCPIGCLPHLLLGHALPLVLLALAGALLGHTLLAMRLPAPHHPIPASPPPPLPPPHSP